MAKTTKAINAVTVVEVEAGYAWRLNVTIRTQARGELAKATTGAVIRFKTRAAARGAAQDFNAQYAATGTAR